jgi:hypothetical protein
MQIGCDPPRDVYFTASCHFSCRMSTKEVDQQMPNIGPREISSFIE